MKVLQASIGIAIVCLGLISSAPSNAQAFCALRDPVSSIYGLFPDADTHRSIVKVVGASARDAIAERLPLDLHFNELGKHTIYVARADDVPVGIVHARSEGDVWGLTEIVWAFSPDLRVVDFKFQRCRNPARNALEDSAFNSLLKGKSFDELKGILTQDAQNFRKPLKALSDDAQKLALLVVHSAMKTIVVTESVWGAEIDSLQSQWFLNQHFKDASSMAAVSTPYTPEIESDIATELTVNGTGINRSQLAMRRVSDENNATLGYVVNAPWRSGSTEANLQWVMAEDGRVLDVAAKSSVVNSKLNSSLDRLVGFEPSSAEHCANALEMSAFELGLLVRKQNGN